MRLTFNVFLQNVVDDGIDVLIHVLEEEGEAVLYSHLQLFEEVIVIEGTHLTIHTEFSGIISRFNKYHK